MMNISESRPFRPLPPHLGVEICRNGLNKFKKLLSITFNFFHHENSFKIFVSNNPNNIIDPHPTFTKLIKEN